MRGAGAMTGGLGAIYVILLVLGACAVRALDPGAAGLPVEIPSKRAMDQVGSWLLKRAEEDSLPIGGGLGAGAESLGGQEDEEEGQEEGEEVKRRVGSYLLRKRPSRQRQGSPLDRVGSYLLRKRDQPIT